jgi:uncharacterized Zn finger protein
MPATNCPPRTRRPHERSVKVLIPALTCDRQRLTLIRITQDGKAAHYWIAPQASAWGLAWTVERAGEEVEDGAERTYDVLLENEQDSSCTCPGHTYHGHCRHVEALRALLRAGKLPLPNVQVSEQTGPKDMTF